MAEVRASRYGGVIDPTDANDPRTRIVNLTPPGSRVLEVGCGSGTIAGYLANAKGCDVLTVEPDPVMAAETRALGLEVWRGHVDAPSTQEALASRGPYDAIIFADVLEHLRDPWAVLRVVRGWLAPAGVVLASVPNVAYWTIRLNLLRSRWEYTDGYLMDRTHLRWFTWRTVQELFTSTGYRIADFQVRWAALPGDRLWRHLVPGRERLYATLAEHWPGLFGYQFVVRAVVDETRNG